MGNPSFAEVIEAGIRTHLSRAFTALPAKVVSYNPVTNTLEAQIGVKAPYFKSDGERAYDEYPNLPNVPVIWPRGAGGIVTTGLEAGDFVWLVFSTLSLAEWRLTGQLSEPLDARRHSIGYPVAIPGMAPDSDLALNPLDAIHIAAGQMIFGKEGGKQVRVSSLGIELAPAGVTPVSPIALAVPLLAFVTAITAASTAGAAADATVATALTNLLTYVSAVAAAAGVTANPGVAAAKTAADASVPAAGTALGASGTAATAASAAATTAGGAVPSTIARAV